MLKQSLALIGLTLSLGANAATIVDHSNGGDVSGIGYSNSGGTTWTVWDDFSLGTDADISGIRYFTNRTITFTNDYTLQIGSAVGLSDVFSAVISNTSATQTIYNDYSTVDASIAGLNLSAGTYWLTFNGVDGLWGSSTVIGDSLIQTLNGDQIIRANAASSFLLTGSVSAVPIPAAAWLFGSALLGLGVIKRKKA